jgi:hypothetical protein
MVRRQSLCARLPVAATEAVVAMIAGGYRQA